MTKYFKSKLYQRASTHLRFRFQPLKRWYFKTVVGPVRSHYGWLSRSLEHPVFFLSPNRKREIFVSRPSEMGDVLLCTPALREFKKRNPDTKIHFFTNYPEIVRGLSYIDSVRPYEERPWDGIEFSYENSLPPNRHIAKIFGDQLNIDVSNVFPDCVFSNSQIRQIRQQFDHFARPWIVVNRKAGPWTPNKDWSDESWDNLIPSLLNMGTVFEIGTGKSDFRIENTNYVNLTGKTNKTEMMALIASADLHIGPISGPVHIAAAAKVPSVVIYGGYESAACSGYQGNINLGTSLNCSPCWLTSPCPISKECLSNIAVEVVLESVKKLLGSQRETYKSLEQTASLKEKYAENTF